MQWLFPLYEGHHVTPLSIYSKKDIEEQRRFNELQLRVERAERALEEFMMCQPEYPGPKSIGDEPRKS